MKTKVILLLAMCLITIFISSCQTARTSRVTQTQIQLAQYALMKEDLPGSGWNTEGKGWESDYGGDGYGITYIRDKHVFINHIVVIHPTINQAKQAYQEWKDEWFNITNVQPKVSYTPSNQNDDSRYECFQLKVSDPLVVCFYLQRHDRIINFVRTSFDASSNVNLTFDEVNNVLGILDKRLNEINIDVTPNGDSP